MRFPFALAALVALAAPAPAADALTALYPDNTIAVLTFDIAKAVGSPLGKKAVGTDPPFTAARKLVSVLLDEDALQFSDAAKTHLAGVGNKLERVTVVIAAKPERLFDLSAVVFLEGPNAEDDYVKAAEGYAKAVDDTFRAEKRGDRKLLSLTKAGLRGASVNKALFALAEKPELLTEVLDRADGKQKASDTRRIAAAVAAAKVAEKPVWLVLSEETLGTGVVTLALNADAEFRLEYRAGASDFSQIVKDALANEFGRLAKLDTRQARVWAAAGVTVKHDNKTVTATGTFPGKLLAEEYARQK